MSTRTETGLRTKFRNLDERDAYDDAVREAGCDQALNFVVDFNFHEANVALNLNSDEFDVLLNQKPPEGGVRWINIWSPGTQRPAVERIGAHYGFSHRLQALMTSSINTTAGYNTPSRAPDFNDVELGPVPPEAGLDRSARIPKSVPEDVEIYQLVKETMNYTSIDHGSRFVCIGANWLHRRPKLGNVEATSSLLPPKHWSWLTLCSDGVVLSLHETPPVEHPDDSLWAMRELKNMRSNTVTVLRQLSKHGVEEYRSRVITLKSVRQALPAAASGCDTAREGSSNLFFYLFEDYSGAVPVLTAARSKIHKLASSIRAGSSRRSKLNTGDVIRPLHKLRKELRQLHHLFESYRSLIRRICRVRSANDQQDGQYGILEPPGHVSGDLRIAPSARSRFERLGDRLQLLMLNTIQEYLDELDALSGTYFNLTAQKDSQATARLSRSATVLAKLSVFFLPISFMTSYFSVEIPNLVEHYTPKMYWVCFTVIAGLSFISLFFFSRLLEVLSDVLEGWADGVSEQVGRLFRLRSQGGRDETLEN
ncbi:ADP-ribosylation factor [Colletotrichum plurivorum]|uniref:ADP-ribosylation factor n=1 Tax=Colletotrichum plurivorum TaxID=2175906 RepID=A0A8H6JKU3_9PEZI|nr:ADP-ribosylation factor [Colletotrichum plurivorum]